MKRAGEILFSVCVALGCSARDTNTVSDAPASTASLDAAQLLRALRAHPAIAAHLPPGLRLQRVGDGFRLEPHRAGWMPAEALALEITAPATTRGPLRLASRGDAGLWLEISDPSLAERSAEVVDGALLYPSAAQSMDVAIGLEHGRAEETRLVRSRGALAEQRWLLRTGPSVSDVRVVDGAVEVLDRAGAKWIASEPIVAFDARDTRRALTVSLSTAGDARVLRASLDPEGLVFPVAIDPAWSPTASLGKARFFHSMAALTDGRVLVAGGSDGSFDLTTSEIYNPTTSTWSAAASMSNTHSGANAVRLLDGRVLVIGGGPVLSEIYDPAANTWTTSGPMAASHYRGGAALNPASGKVYAAGGSGFSAVFEEFDPATGNWKTLAPMISPRDLGGLVVLPGNTKLLVAGSTGTGSTAEVYDLATNTWRLTTNTMSGGHATPFMTVAAGKAHVMGSGVGHDVYDPVTDTWSPGPPLKLAREPGYATGVLTTGKLLIVGGYNSPSEAEIYDPSTDVWTISSPLPAKRHYFSGAPLAGGRFLIAGGTEGGGPIASAHVFALATNGAACTIPGECTSTFCVDGRCCDRACNTGACEACDVSGSLGTCSPVTSGAPHGTRTCSPFASCVAPGTCATSCSSTTPCASTHYCTGGACVSKKTNGVTCTASGECASGNCVDGVCCNRACAGQCESCNRPTSLGSCAIMTGAPAAGRPACPGLITDPKCGQRCDGASPNCTYPPVSTPCSGATCTAGIETHPSFCDAAGTCSDTPKSCAAYVCGPTACLSTCTTNSQCASGFHCASGACVPVADLGRDCSTGGSCGTGFCVDGVCCGSAACDAGSSCANPGNKGRCSKANGTTCSSNAECGSGQCVDGVCCDTKCDGQCEACDVTGRVGRCFPVSGKPHGARVACDDGAGDACKARACDGAKDTTACVGYAGGPSTECRAASCVGSTLTEAGYCDGSGACRAPGTKSCAPFACDMTGSACRTTCTTKDDCSTGNTCQGGACVPGATCSSDGLSSITKEGNVSCAPFRCRDGNCASSCTASTDCAGGFVCDASNKCVQPAPTEDGGGCQMSASGRAGAPLALVALFALLTRRRVRSGQKD